MNALKTWWQGLNPREQRVVSIGGIVLGLILVYLVLWQPLSDYAINARQQAIRAERLSLWMLQSDKRLRSVQRGEPRAALSADSAVKQLTVSLKQAGLAQWLSAAPVLQGKQLQLAFHSVSFDALMVWLSHFSHRYTVSVSALQVSALKASGMVKAHITLALTATG